MYSIDFGGREPFRRQPFNTTRMRFPAAQRADIKSRRADGDTQGRIIQLGIVGKRDHRCAAVEIEAFKPVIGPFVHDCNAGESFFRCK